MLVEDMTRNSVEEKRADLILLGFSFEKVNCEKLFLKLHQYGIRGQAL